MKRLDYVIEATSEYIKRMPKSQRKKYGQFFISKEIANFMAELFTVPQGRRSISVLDPGAGSGILSIALLDRLETIEAIESVELICYENDSNIIELLESNMEWVCTHTMKNVSCRVVTDNYILSQSRAYNHMMNVGEYLPKYDMIIGNPPYMKIAKDSAEAVAMSDICYGTPNLYFLFASMSLFNLKDHGEMVYIIPRSWTSGAYFKRFRENIFTHGVLEHIHLFESRDKVFKKEHILQEIIIIKMKKTDKKPKKICITTTKNSTEFSKKTVFEASYATVVNSRDSYVYLITNVEDAQNLKRLKRWKNTLPDIGLKMRTGLTVDFRNRTALRDLPEENTVPLFYSQHIREGKIIFPLGRKCEYITTGQNTLLQRNENYLFVKRFTAKEERRRLQCGVYLARRYPKYTEISTQNKINFICGLRELSECVVYGLYVLFNSTLYDCYYRILSGSTQVNATEINAMPVPSIEVIELMGKELMEARSMSETICDTILQNYI